MSNSQEEKDKFAMNLIPSTDPRLREKSLPFDFDTGVTVDGQTFMASELFELLKTKMIENRGLGLSAIQIGIPTRVFVIGDPSNSETIIPVFNPLVLDNSSEQEYYEEGCLSFPGLYIKVKRPSQIRVRYSDHLRNTDTIKFDGMTARIFLHEYDHMDGIVFTQVSSMFHREKAKRQKKKLDRLRAKNRG